MLAHHLILHCDHRSCPEQLVSEPLFFHGSERDEDELLERAAREGWVRVPPGTGQPARRYCPAHRFAAVEQPENA
jgi:hypothetical protein